MMTLFGLGLVVLSSTTGDLKGGGGDPQPCIGERDCGGRDCVGNRLHVQNLGL